MPYTSKFHSCESKGSAPYDELRMKLRYLFQATGMEKSGEFATSGTGKGF